MSRILVTTICCFTSPMVLADLELDLILEFSPAACVMHISQAQVDLGLIPFASLPQSGSSLLDRGNGLTWSAEQGPQVAIDCGGHQVPLAVSVSDNQAHSLDHIASNSWFGLGRFAGSRNTAIGYFQLLPQQTLIQQQADNRLRVTNASQAVQDHLGNWQVNPASWQDAQGVLFGNRDGHINTWQGILDNNGTNSLHFGLAGKVFLNGQDQVASDAHALQHQLQGSVTLTIMLY